jgi:phosphatidylglycerophosphatase A
VNAPDYPNRDLKPNPTPMHTAWPDLLGDSREQAGAPLTGPAPLAAQSTAAADATPPAEATRWSASVRIAGWIARGFGSGNSPWAPGTAGTLWAWAIYLALDATLLDGKPAWMWGAVIGATALVGIWASKVTALAQGIADPGSIVIDEIVAFWLVLWLIMPASLPLQLAAFALFRFFDAVKFGFVAWADRSFKGFGWTGAFGILADDLCAAFMTLLVLAIGMRVL